MGYLTLQLPPTLSVRTVTFLKQMSHILTVSTPATTESVPKGFLQLVSVRHDALQNGQATDCAQLSLCAHSLAMSHRSQIKVQIADAGQQMYASGAAPSLTREDVQYNT